MENENKKFKIFVSWHSDQHDKNDNGKPYIPYSKAVAEEYKRFIEFVFECKDCVFCSAVDIIGNWRKNLETQLRDCDYAIFVITDKAIESGWLHAEYGAFMMKSILESDNPDYTNLFPVCELRGNNEVSISGPIKDLQVFYPDCDSDPSKKETFKTKFKELLSRVPIDKPNFATLFDLNFDIFRKRVGEYKKKGTICSDLIGQIEKYQYKHVETQPVAESQASASSSIDFDKIHFEFRRPRTMRRGEKMFFGRVKFVETLFDKFQEQHCINIRARGGMGKTSVSYIFKDWVDKHHPDYYYKQHFITVNINSETSIRSAVNKNLKDIIDEAYPGQLKEDEKWGEDTLTKRIGYDFLAKVPKKCLLVIDVNSDDDADEAHNGRKNMLFAIDFPEEMENKWDILYLCREKIGNAYEDDDTILKNFEDDFDGAKGLFENIYKRKKLDDNQLLTLFKSVFYHPLLIEQLAAYGEHKKKDYNELCNVVSENRLKNNSVQEFSEYNIIYNNRKVNIVPYLGALFDYDEFNVIQKYILQHFALWEYDYIPLSAIKSLLRKYSELDIEDSLYELVDALVLTSDDEKGFRIHGLLADRLREQPFDYTDYIRTICGMSRGNVDQGIRSCLRSTPIELFAEEKYLPLYKQIGGLVSFLNKMKQVRYDGWALDFAYKAELLRRYYEYEDSQLSQKLLGEYKDKSSYHVYYDWLETQEGYDATVPDDGIVKIEGSNCKFKMIKVDGGECDQVRLSDYYIGETQVTQELYREITKRNPSCFNERRLKKNTDNHPVETVSWFDCLEFLIQLNERTGLKFRFPTEAQWEFAARGGQHHSPYKYSGSDKLSDVAWYGYFDKDDKNRTITKETTMPVVKKNPNELGIYDMSGNVFEWCQDWIGEYNSEPQTDPQGPSSGSSRVLRGGSWCSNADRCRVSLRYSYYPDDRDDYYGLRLALVAP